MNWPEQRQVVVAVPGGDRFALLGQGLDATLLRQEFSYLAPERVVGLLRLCRFSTWPKMPIRASSVPRC